MKIEKLDWDGKNITNKMVWEKINEITGEVNALTEQKTAETKPANKTIELEINLPAADIEGLQFNKQTVRGKFELKEDGNYYSKNILFLSARDLNNKTGHDLLSKYLNCSEVRGSFGNALIRAGYKFENDLDRVHIFLPEKNQGVKYYNGVSWLYWLRPAASSSSFAYVYSYGFVSIYDASSVGGCAPAFRVARHE
jgi:hypothetical protein